MRLHKQDRDDAIAAILLLIVGFAMLVSWQAAFFVAMTASSAYAAGMVSRNAWVIGETRRRHKADREPKEE